jgi:tetratricopeptide (TPR) repeat protein
MIPALLALTLAAPALSSQAAATPGILVVPFETPARDGRTYWLGEAIAVLMADDMNARGLAAIPRQARERAYEQLHLPAHGVLSRATVIKVGELVGANEVIVGEVRVDGDALTIKATPIRIDIGRADADLVEHGSLADLIPVAQKLARRIVPDHATAPPPPAPPLHAFEQFIKGLIAERPAAQAEFLESAIRIDPHYDAARLALWDVRTGQGDYAAALAQARAVGADSSLAKRARFLASLSLIALKQYDDAFTVLKSLDSANPAVLNNLGVVQIRRSGNPDLGKPTYFFTKAAEGDPDDSDVLFNLGYAYALDRDPQAAIYWLRETLRRNPADGDAHVVLASALEAAGSTVEAARERELATRLSSRSQDVGPRAPLPRGLERVRQEPDAAKAGGVGQALAATAQRDQQNVAQFHLERGRRLFAQEQDREALAELKRAVFLSPYEAEAHLLIGRIYLRAGRPREAVDALKISIWSRDSAQAHVALGEAYLSMKDAASARAEAQRALAVDPSSNEATALLRKIDGGGGSPLPRVRGSDRASC